MLSSSVWSSIQKVELVIKLINKRKDNSDFYKRNKEIFTIKFLKKSVNKSLCIIELLF